MKVVCLVPSWTETLIEAGVDVVGRTRFCIHPADRVASIPVVGGTKDTDLAKVAKLAPDLIVLDREENPRAVAEQTAVPVIATHVTAVHDVSAELDRLSERLSQPELTALAQRWRRISQRFAARQSQPDWQDLPGVLDWIRQPGPEVDRFIYLIWKDPWMAVGPETFIGSMLALLGFGSRMVSPGERYPKVRLEDLDQVRTLLLFSTEPYRFAAHQAAIAELPFASALVDGQSFGWFGLRALRFLEEHARQARI
jgi:hypothetical protein